MHSAGFLATLRRRSRASAFRSTASRLKPRSTSLGRRSTQRSGSASRAAGAADRFRRGTGTTSIVVLFAVLVEFGSAFGLFLALLPIAGLFPARRSRQSGNIQPRWRRHSGCGRCTVTDRHVRADR